MEYSGNEFTHRVKLQISDRSSNLQTYYEFLDFQTQRTGFLTIASG